MKVLITKELKESLSIDTVWIPLNTLIRKTAIPYILTNNYNEAEIELSPEIPYGVLTNLDKHMIVYPTHESLINPENFLMLAELFPTNFMQIKQALRSGTQEYINVVEQLAKERGWYLDE